MLKTIPTSLAVATTLALSFTPDVIATTGYAVQTSDEYGIKVTVILKDSWNEGKDLEFEVTLETHTKTLNDDLAKSSLLVADGKQYLPASWEGAAPGGHHRKGLLRFKVIGPQPRTLELQLRLRLTGENSPRSFKWLLK